MTRRIDDERALLTETCKSAKEILAVRLIVENLDSIKPPGPSRDGALQERQEVWEATKANL